MNRIGLIYGLFAALGVTPVGAQELAPVPIPEVSGPAPGRIFFATTEDLGVHGYVEEEYFLEGFARQYELSAAAPFRVGEVAYPYRTRVVVRRPAEAAGFNGTVLVEWLNVTVGFDIDIDWMQARTHILRSGYAWVGVSAQRVGVHGEAGLRNWDPDRYGTLDLTADSTLLRDELAYDIFAQAVSAIRNPERQRILGPLTPQVVVATGHSQSASRLAAYHNRVHPMTEVVDGFLIHGGGEQLTVGLDTKVFKINAETDLWAMRQLQWRQPDSDRLRTWEVAGASHADEYYMAHLGELQARDFGATLTISCDEPAKSRIPFRYALHAAYDHLVAWITRGIPPPRAQPLEVVSVEPEIRLVRSTFGNAQGGVQLPHHAVPTALNSGRNGGGAFCRFYGTHVPFDEATLRQLYSTRDAYVEALRSSIERNLEAGFILPSDAEEMLREAMARWPGPESTLPNEGVKLTRAEIRFEWDLPKARSNEKKHGVFFEEAQTTFLDEQGLLLDRTACSWSGGSGCRPLFRPVAPTSTGWAGR